MKRLIVIFFLLFLFSNNVKASEVYYSEYGKFSDYEETKIQESELVNIESEKRYLWYKEVKNVGSYGLLLNDDRNYDLEDCYETEFTDWMDGDYGFQDGYIYEARNIYTHTMANDLRYIHLYDLYGSYGAIRITELSVFYNEEEINYMYYCDGCWDGFGDYIHNGIFEENNSYINNGGKLIIDLGKNYPVNKIKIIFYIFDLGTDDKKYTIGYSSDKENIYVFKNYILKFSDFYWANSKKIIHHVYDFTLPITNFTTKKQLYELISNEYVMDVSISKQYRFKEKWCRTYSMEKEFHDKYSSDIVLDYINKDLESEKIFYRYQKRDKLELEITKIENYDFDLKSFVKNASGDYSIKSNIDWYKNGTYQINFSLNNLSITKDVTVDIESNRVNDLEREKEDLLKEIEILNQKYLNDKQTCEEEKRDLNEKIKLLQFELEKKETELKKLNIENKKILEEKNNLILNLEQFQLDIKNLNNEIENLKEENKNYNLKILEMENEYNKIEQEKNNLIKNCDEKILSFETKNNFKNIFLLKIKFDKIKNLIPVVIFVIVLFIYRFKKSRMK